MYKDLSTEVWLLSPDYVNKISFYSLCYKPLILWIKLKNDSDIDDLYVKDFIEAIKNKKRRYKNKTIYCSYFRCDNKCGFTHIERIK